MRRRYPFRTLCVHSADYAQGVYLRHVAKSQNAEVEFCLVLHGSNRQRLGKRTLSAEVL